MCDKDNRVALSDMPSADGTKKEESIKQNKEEENSSDSCIKLPSAPKTAVQFFMNWEKHISSDFQYRYLKVSDDLPIFLFCIIL